MRLYLMTIKTCHRLKFIKDTEASWNNYIYADIFVFVCQILPGDSDISLESVRLLLGTKLQEASVSVSGYENNDR